jgi:hypothetical protein
MEIIMKQTTTKKFKVQYKCKDKIAHYVSNAFRNKNFTTDILAKDKEAAEKYFQRFFPMAQIVSINEL